MRLRSMRIAAVWASPLLLAGCGKDAPPPRPAATNTTPPAEPAPVVSPAASAPVANRSKLGGIPVTRDLLPPPAGQCGATDGNRITYTGDTPGRTVTIAVGDTSRPFRPRWIEIKVEQTLGTLTETESIYAAFTAAGSLDAGTRDYVNSNGPATRESVRLSAEDAGLVKQLANQVLGWCK